MKQNTVGSRAWAVVAIAAGSLALAALWFGLWGPTDPTVGGTSVDEPATVARSELPRVSRQTTPVVHRFEGDPDEFERSRGNEESRRTAETGQALLQERYQAEPVDHGWAATRQHSLESLQGNAQISQLGAQPVAFEADCRSSTCRIRADFASRVAADDWVTLYLLDPGVAISRSSFLRTDYPDGTSSIELYGQAR